MSAKFDDFLVGLTLEKPTIEFARRSAVEVGSIIVFRFMTPGVQEYPYRKFIYPYVCMYVFLYLVGLRIIYVAKKHKNGMFLNAGRYTAMKQSC